jgi:prolipoprotein diacylglyceryl transferase
MAVIALWAVPAGVIGARLYHVITDWQRFDDSPLDVFRIWEGGLGIPGGMFLGVVVGVYVGHWKRGIPTSPGLAAVVPALPLAQAIGRWGNWWNQELFGRPTDLPWALEVSDAAAVAAGYPPGTTFHPTFLYESLWNFGLCGLLIWADRRFRPRGYQMVALYVLGYGVGRLWVEMLRIDPANEIGPFRVNEVVSVAAIVLSLAALALGPRLGWGRAGDPDVVAVAPAAEAEVVDVPAEAPEAAERADDTDAREGSDPGAHDATSEGTGPPGGG